MPTSVTTATRTIIHKLTGSTMLTLLSLTLLACHENKTKPSSSEMNVDSSGVARYQGSSTCTAALLDTGNAGVAYALTAGHCAQHMSLMHTGWEVIKDTAPQNMRAAYERHDTLTFNYDDPKNNSSKKPIRVGVKNIVYSSMHNTDLAILQLDRSLQQLKAQGIHAYTLSAHPVRQGDAVRMIGAASDEYLTTLRCQQGDSVDLLEGAWYWRQAGGNNCRGIKAGHSGSPMFDNRGQIVGVMGTTNEGLLPTNNCIKNVPCEVSNNTRTRPNTSYAHATAALAHCFDNNGLWQLSSPNCPLSKHSSPAFFEIHTFVVRPSLAQPAMWQFVSADSQQTNLLSYKIGNLGVVDCDSDTDYHPFQLERVNQTALPTAEGHYLACIRSNTGITRIALQIDKTPPTIAPVFYTSSHKDSNNQIYHYVDIADATPEYSSIQYALVDNQTACTSAVLSDYQFAFTYTPKQVLCLQGADLAGNQSQRFAFVLN